MIEYKDRVFHISAPGMSYMFRADDYGLLEHLCFGPAASMADAAALAVKPGTGWGCSVVLREDDNASCPDVLPLEWSGAGRGDYREAPAELETDDGPASTDFRYEGYEIIKGCAPIKCGLPQADGGTETLVITMRDDALKAELKLYFTQFGAVVARRAELVNLGARPLYVRKLMSFSTDLAGEYDMHSFSGGWIAEARKNVSPVGGARVVNESVTGFSSNRANPGFILAEKDAGEDNGRVYGFNLVYSGSHYASAQRSLQGLTRVMQGMSPADFRRKLMPGESFETPEAVMAFSEAGFNGLSHIMHDFVNAHIVPRAWRYRERPVLYNDWEGCMFSFDESRLLDLAGRAKKLGCELFVLDDGWFGGRNSDRAGLGDYNVNEKKLPSGIGGLAKKIGRMGLKFGLWFEPEAVNPDSDLFRAHPDWALAEPGRESLTSRHELLLDLRKEEVRDYIVSSVCGVLDGADVKYVKWDMNRQSCALGTAAHGYILGLYDVLRRIFAPRPDILLETCSSGGNRFDLGMLCFSPQIWCSDDTDPIERLDIQGGLSYLYPQSCMGAHVSASPHAQTLRRTPLYTRGNVSFFGVLGYELDLKDLLPVETREIKAQIAFYKAHRELFQFGEFTRLPAPGDAAGWQVTKNGVAAAGIFRRLVRAAPGYDRVRFAELSPDKRYRVESRKQSLRVGGFGSLIKYVSPVRISVHGALLRTADKHYAMPDGGDSFTASGRTLLAGFSPAGRFTGAGYDRASRNQGDFGSEIYVIAEETGHVKKR
jgi:alpha-galactosidase